MTVCTICRCEWPTVPTRCVCGYDFATGNTHEAIRSLAIQQRGASRRSLAGLALFSSTIISVALASVYPEVLVALPLIATIQVLFGFGLVTTGLVRVIRVGRQLARAKTMHQLPPARLLR